MSNRVNLTLDIMKASIKNPLITVRQGEGNFETLRATVNSNGNPLDLQGWTITFMGTTAGKRKIIDSDVTIVDASKGIFEYTPSKAWGMDVGGFKIAYFKFVSGDGSTSSANFQVEVIEAVDLTQEEAQDYISVVDATIYEIDKRLNDSLANVTQSIAETSSAASSLSVNVSSVASSTVNQINNMASSAVDNVDSVASNAVNNVSVTASGAVDNVNDTASNVVNNVNSTASSAVSQVNSAASNASSVASSAVSNVNSAANVYVKKSGDTMTGGLQGGVITLPESGDLNDFMDTGKYYQNLNANAVKWNNRPANAPDVAFSVDVITSSNKELVTQTFYAYQASRMWVRNLQRAVSGLRPSPWVELANDTSVVHKTGSETIAGDKTLVGNTNLATTTILAGSYGLRVTTSGIQKTTDGKTWVAANI